MRKTLLSLLVSAFMCVLPMTAAVQYTLAPVGFENGALPSTWTVDQISGSATWAVEGGAGTTLTNPNGAKEGVYRAVCKIPVGSADQSVVRLITPAMNLAGVTQPQLFFSHAQSATSGLIDTLRVFYRTSANGQWKVAAEYTTAITAWKDECITLSEAGGAQAYQIAFEASCSAGRKGVVLDQIFVRPASLCLNVSDINVMPMADNALVTFTESGSAETWQVLVDTVQITDWANYNTANAVYFDQALYEYETTIPGLTPYTQYYVYVRSYCDDNETGFTDWVSVGFKTTQRVDGVPYVVNFEDAELDGTGSYKLPAGWTAGHSEDITTLIPYVAPSMSNTYKGYYSVDSTAFLTFGTQSTSAPAALEAGSYAYVATPLISTALNGCEVSFWGTAYTNIYNTSADYAGELQVGVMSNPEDWSSFELIETVKLDHANQHKHFVVSLASYTGNGKFVALASNSGKKNFFAVDKFEVRAITGTPTNVHLTEVLPTSIKVAANASTFDAKVFLADDYVAGGVLPAVTPLATATAANGVASIALTDDLQGEVISVYVGSNGNYAFPITFRVPTVWSHDSVPYSFTFNTGSFSTIPLKNLGKEIHTSSSSSAIGDVFFPLKSLTAFYPKQGNPSPAYDGGALQLEGAGAYFTLPYVDSFDGLQVSLRLSAGASSYAGRSRVAVGMMTNPYDIATFDTLGVYEGAADGYLKVDQDFAAYQGNGHYVAILALAPKNSTRAAMSYIDNLMLQVVPTCRDAANLSATVGSSKANLSWDGKGMTEWLVKVATNNTFRTIVVDTIVSTESLEVTGLTPNTNYYFCVQAICGTDTLARDAVVAFKTAIGVPYTDASLSSWTKWMGLMADAFAGNNPTSTTSGWNSNTTAIPTNHMKVNIYGGSCKYWLMSPAILVEGDANTAIRLSFDAAYTKYASATAADGDVTDDKFAVLITTDGGDTWLPANATIWAGDGTGDYLITSIPNTPTTYNIDLSAFIGQVINVAFYGESTSSGGDNDMHVGNVSIASFDANCAGVSRFSAVATSANEATINWQVQGAQSIDIEIATDAEFTNVVSNQTYTTSPVSITDLVPNTAYYVRARQTCDSEGEWTLATFRTYCAAITPEMLGVEDFSDAARLDCWTLGHMIDAAYGSDPVIKTDNKFGKYLYLAKTSAYPTYKDGLFAVMPELDLQGDSINKFEVSFNAGTSSNDAKNVARLTVGVITDPSDYSTFVETRTFNLSLANDSVALGSYSVSFADYLGDDNDGYGSYIIFYVQAGDSSLSSVVLDNVKVSRARSCRQPEGLAASEVTEASAILTWTGYSNSYEVLVLDHAINPDTLTTEPWTVVAGDSLAVENLEGLTTYYAYVRGVCDADDKSNWFGPVAFKTHCAPITYPWSENFESMSTGSSSSAAPECWAMLNTNQGAYPYAYVNNSSSYVHGGTKSLYFVSSNAVYSYVMLPYFQDLSHAGMTFWYRDESATSSGYLYVGYLTDETDESTFVQLAELTRTTTFTQADVLLSSVPAGARVAFKYGGASSNYYLGIDDIEIYELPTCVALNAINLVENSTNSLKLAFDNINDQLLTYEYTYVASGATVDLTQLQTTTADTVEISGLTPGASYNVYVRSICQEGDTADWKIADFTTAYGVPFDEDFEATTTVPADWSRRSGDLFKNTTATASGWYFTSSSNGGGLSTSHLYNSVSNSTYSGPTKYALLTPEIQLSNVAGEELELSFLMALTSSSSSSTAPAAGALTGRIFAVAISTDGGQTFAANDAFVWGDSTANMGIYGDIAPEARPYTISLNDYAGQNVVVAFYHAADSTASSTSTYINLDEVKLHSVLAGCETPTGLSVDSVTTNSADFHWDAEEGESYELQIGTTNKFAVVVVDTVVTGGNIHIDGLAPASTFYARVSKVCGTGHGEWSQAQLLTTACATISQLPWSENFFTLTAGIPNCWDNSLGTTTSDTHKWNYYKESDNNICLRFNSYSNSTGNTNILLTPEIALPEQAARLKVRVKNPTGGNYSLAVTTDGGATYTNLLTNLTGIAAWSQKEIDLAQFAGQTVRFAFLATSNYGNGDAYLYVDDILVELAPQNETLNSVTIGGVQRRSFNVNWTVKANVECNDYHLVLSTTALNEAQLDSATFIEVSGATSYSFDHLERDTRYYVYVRTACAIGDGYGMWVGTSAKTLPLSGEMTIGTEQGTSSALPTNLYFNYTTSEQIYTAAEIGNAGPVLSIGFNYLNGGSAARDLSIYFKHVPATSFASSTAWIPVDASDLVYQGQFTFNGIGWQTIDLTNSFVYNGVDNLLVVVDDNTGSYLSSGMNFATFSGALDAALYSANDGTNYDPFGNFPSSGTTSSSRNQLQLAFLIKGCPEVAEVSVSGLTSTSATLEWTASEADYLGSYQVVLADSVVTNFSNPTYVGIDSLSLALNELSPYTTYHAYVRAICNGEQHNDGVSGWTHFSFRTLADCNALENVVVTPVAKTEVEVSWTASAQDANYCYILSGVQLEASMLDTMPKTASAITDTVVTISGLAYDSTYYVYVANECGVGAYSPFYEVSFRTAATCPAVANLHTASVAFNAVQLQWESGLFGEETEWEVGVVGNAASVMTVTEPIAVIIGLQAETAYTFYVKAICSENESSAVATVSCTTSAEPADEVVIGAGASTSNNFPTYTYYNYSLTEQIYTAEEINNNGSIIGLSFFYTGSATTSRDVNIYLAHTSESVFTGDTNADWIPVSEGDLVFSGTLDLLPNTSVDVEFSVPFEYNGTDNLLLVADDNTGSYVNGGTFAVDEADEYRSFYHYSDTDNNDPTAPHTYGYRSKDRDAVNFHFVSASCRKAAQVQLAASTMTSATLTWFPGGSETQWLVFLSDTELTDAQINAAQKDTLNRVMTKTYTGLVSDQDYYFYIQSLCSASDRSDWKMFHFITVPTCAVPAEVSLDSVTAHNAYITWSPLSADFAGSYMLAYGLTDSFDLADVATYETITTTDTAVTLSGLKATTVYSFAVRALCGPNDDSRWSEPIAFITDCGVISEFPYLENFDNAAAWTMSNGVAYPMCWPLGGYQDTYNSYVPSIAVNTNSTIYSYSGRAALLIETNSYYSTTASVAAMPELQGNLDTLVLKFKMRACTQSVSSNTVSSGYYSSTYAHAIKVGTLTALSMNTLTPLATFTLENNLSYGDVLAPVNDFGWEEFELPLAGVTAPYIVFYSDYTNSNIVYIDDVRIEGQGECPRPAVTVVNYTTKSAVVTWSTVADSYNAILLNGTDTVATWNAFTADTLTINGLYPGTEYTVLVQNNCDNTTSEWGRARFTTSYGVPFVEALTIVPDAWARYYTKASDVFGGAQFTTTTSGWNVQSASSAPQGMGDHLKVNIYGTSCKYWLVSPTIDLSDSELENVRLSFDAAWTKYANTIAPTETSTDDMFMVAISTDGGANWSAANAFIWKNDGTGDMGLVDDFSHIAQNVVIDLSQYVGGNITIGFYGESTVSGGDNDFHIANVVVNSFNANCAGVNGVTATATIDQAVVSWGYNGGAADALVQVARDNGFGNIVYTDTIRNDSSCTVMGLTASTTYYVRVRQLCAGGEESAFSSPAICRTSNGLPFYEPFNNSDNFSMEWYKYGSKLASEVYAGDQLTSSTSGWAYTEVADGIASGHIRQEAYSSSGYNYWTSTPDIDMTNVTSDGVMLSFKAAWSKWSGSTTTQEPDTTNTTLQFHVAVSNNQGQTWAPIAIWTNDGTGDHRMTELLTEQEYNINLSQYAGQVIRVAFHAEQSVSGGDQWIHVDDVKLDRCEAEVISDEICDNEDYVANGFAITSDSYKPGLNVFSQVLRGQAADGGDKIVLLNLQVNPTYSMDEYMTTCQGEQVVFGDYSFTASSSMDLPYTMTTATGCDSTVVLHLTVNKPVVVDTVIKACEEYTYNGVTYQLSTTISDTLQSVATGCDSIYNVLIQIAHDGGKAEAEKAVLCVGGTYEWNGREYTKGGVYTIDTVTAGGCDLQLELQLFEADALGNVYDTITVDDLPYSFAGDEYLGANVGEGDYQFTIRTSCGQGTLYVHVGKKQEEPVEGLLNAKDRANAKKVVVDGLLYLTVGDRWYDAQGRAAIKPIEEK